MNTRSIAYDPRMSRAIRAPWDALVDLFKGGVSKRFALIAIALGLVLLVAIWFVFAILPGLAVHLDHLSDNERLQRENDVRTTGLQALAGAVLAIGAAFTAYSVLSAREGQLDERFARSLELMSSKDAHVVSGAVFSLERIGTQSWFDRAAVVDVLSGFARSGVPVSRDGGEVPPEVMDALHALGRINKLWRSPPLNLEKTSWKDASLLSLDLSEARLGGSTFEGATLTEVKFRRAILISASFARAHLFSTDFSRAYLRGADFSGASLSGVKLTKATLAWANFQKADLTEVRLRGVDLEHADLSDVDLRFSSLHKVASLKEARYTAKTKFPEGFDPKEHDMVLLEPPSSTEAGVRGGSG